jgi:hypothetical protein
VPAGSQGALPGGPGSPASVACFSRSPKPGPARWCAESGRYVGSPRTAHLSCDTWSAAAGLGIGRFRKRRLRTARSGRSECRRGSREFETAGSRWQQAR